MNCTAHSSIPFESSGLVPLKESPQTSDISAELQFTAAELTELKRLVEPSPCASSGLENGHSTPPFSQNGTSSSSLHLANAGTETQVVSRKFAGYCDGLSSAMNGHLLNNHQGPMNNELIRGLLEWPDEDDHGTSDQCSSPSLNPESPGCDETNGTTMTNGEMLYSDKRIFAMKGDYIQCALCDSKIKVSSNITVGSECSQIKHHAIAHLPSYFMCNLCGKMCNRKNDAVRHQKGSHYKKYSLGLARISLTIPEERWKRMVKRQSYDCFPFLRPRPGSDSVSVD